MARKGDGVDDKMVSAALTLPSQYTVSFWYQNAAAPGNAVYDQPFAWNSSFNQGIGFSWDHITAGSRQAWWNYDGNYDEAKYTSTFSADTWYHLCATYDGTNLKAWLNGTNEATTASGAPADSGSETINVFASAGGGSSFDDGVVAELGVWNDDLTAGEIAELAKGKSPITVRPANQLHYYPIWGRNSPEIDLVGGNNLTVTGTTVVAHPRVIYRRKRQAFNVAAAAATAGFGLSAIAAAEVHGGGGFVNQGLHQIDAGIGA